MTIEFWIGIVFWCVNQTCGLATHTISFPTRQECLHEVRIMQNQIRMDRHQKPNIIEGRCSPQQIHIRQDSYSNVEPRTVPNSI